MNRNRQRLPEILLHLTECERALGGAVQRHFLDGQSIGVQHELGSAGLDLDGKRCRPGQNLPVEIDVEIEGEMAHDGLFRPRKRMDVSHGARSICDMPCDHVGGPELIEMAEAYLRENGIAEADWPGRRFRWSENLEDGMWASVLLEIERRGEQWIVTRIDRNRERLSETGFNTLS
jgi:hypothetical protein